MLGAGDVAVVDSLLRSGQWLEDTSQLSAELARSRKSDIRDFSEERSSSSPMVIPLYSMRTSSFLNLQVFNVQCTIVLVCFALRLLTRINCRTTCMLCLQINAFKFR